MSSFDNQLNGKQQQQQQQQQQDISKLKRNMTLDFNSGIPSNKKSKFIKNCVLESPGEWIGLGNIQLNIEF